MYIRDQLMQYTTENHLAEIRHDLIQQILNSTTSGHDFDWGQKITFENAFVASPLHVLLAVKDEEIPEVRYVLNTVLQTGHSRDLKKHLLKTPDSKGRACFDYDIDFRVIPE